MMEGSAEPGCGWVVSSNSRIWRTETEEDLAHTTPCLVHVPKLNPRGTVPLTPNLDDAEGKTKTKANPIPPFPPIHLLLSEQHVATQFLQL